MSGTTEASPTPGWPSGSPDAPVGTAAERPDLRARVLPVLVDAWIVVVWFAVAGVIGALVWWQVTPLAAYTRTADNGTMDERQLAIQISTDGWYFVVALVGGLVSGIALLTWRRRRPVLMVLLVGGCGFLASVLMHQVGLGLGPSNPNDVLPHLSVGDKAPLQLKPLSHGLRFVWSVGALAGAALGLFVGEFVASNKRHRDQMKQYYATQTPGQVPAQQGADQG